MADDLDSTIRDAAAGPSSASNNSGSMSQHPLPHLIEADKHLGNKKAGRSRKLPMRLAKIKPGGAI